MSSRKELPFDAIKFLEKSAISDPDTAIRVKALRALIRHASQQEARESSLRGLALISLEEDPSSDLAGVWLDHAKDPRGHRDPSNAIKLAEGADPGKGVVGYGILMQIEADNRAPESARTDATKAIARAWQNPRETARILRAIGLSKLTSYSAKVPPLLKDSPTEVRQAAEFAARRLDLAPRPAATTRASGKPIALTSYDQVLAIVLKDPGEVSSGAQLFEKQGCVNCHSVSKSDAIKGPYLGDVTTRYNRSELTESILKPSARIAQGFETQKIALSSGQVYEGFVVREAGDELEMRNSAGNVTILSKKDIEERNKAEISVMPQGLLDPLTPHDLASILAYLESLKGK